MSWISRLTNVFRPDRLSNELDRELEFHIAERTAALVNAGMTPAEAAREARRRFGNRTAMKEKAHDVSVLAWLESLGADIRYAMRGLRATPGFTLVAILSLALGIGANTAIFSLANALVFKTLPVRDPGSSWRWRRRRMASTTSRTRSGSRSATGPISSREGSRTAPSVSTSRTAVRSSKVPGAWVSGDFFSVLGVHAVAGRALLRADDVRGCAPTAVVSAGFAQRTFGSADSSVGKSISLNGHPFTIVGAIDPDFFGIEVGRTVDVYAPLCTQAILFTPDILDHRSRWFLNIAGRPPEGVSPAQMGARLAAASPAIFEATVPPRFPAADQVEYRKIKLAAKPAASGFSEARDRYRGALFTLMAVVGVVLLIACANIANLLLARATAREREIAIRLAIGAGRGRVVRQLLTESLVLALLGAGLGLMFARWASGLLIQFISSSRRPLWLDLSLDLRVLAFAAGAAALTAVLFGLVPAWRATRVDPQTSLKAGGRGVVRGDGRHRLGKVLVVAQVSLSLALVAAAGLLVNSFRRLNTFDSGFKREGVLVVGMEFANSGYTGEPLEQVKSDILRRARGMPGVTAASTALLTPMGSMSWNDFVVVPGVTPRTQKDSLAFFNAVSDGYFTTLGTALLAGRDLSADDIAQKRRVAVVNETFAKRWFASGNPIGRTFQTPSGDTLKPPIEVVGVVRDTKYQRIDETNFAIAYLPHGVNEPSDSYVQLVLRTGGAPSALVPAVRALAADVNSRISLDITTLDAQVDASLARPRLLATLSGFMGALALVLAVIGLYGMMSYDVERRRNEIGIRKALGAPVPLLWRMVAGEASRLIGAGVVIGALIALASTRLISSFLFGLTATDPATFIFAAVVLAASGMLAASLPAWRAARLDPMEALREE